MLAAVGTAIAQRPSNTSICDYYTTALLKNNTAANQYSLLTLVVVSCPCHSMPHAAEMKSEHGRDWQLHQA